MTECDSLGHDFGAWFLLKLHDDGVEDIRFCKSCSAPDRRYVKPTGPILRNT